MQRNNYKVRLCFNIIYVIVKFACESNRLLMCCYKRKGNMIFTEKLHIQNSFSYYLLKILFLAKEFLAMLIGAACRGDSGAPLIYR
jgi:hypothetical protein